MELLIALLVGVVILGLIVRFGPGLAVQPEEVDLPDEPTEEADDDPSSHGLGVSLANPMGSFLGTTMPDLAPPEGEEE